MVASSATPGRAGRLGRRGALLFAYGTLQFPDVLTALIDRVPHTEAAAATGWRPAALAGRSYPGLVAAAGTATGVVLAGLSDREIQLIDDFESGPYDLRHLLLADGRTAWAYVWTDVAAVLPHDWSKLHFADARLATFISQCRSWRATYETAGRVAGGLYRPQDG